MPELNPDWEVSALEVKRMLDAGEDFVLLDVRQPEEYALAHIEGAQLVPLGDIPQSLPNLLEHSDRLIITHCHKGVRSLNAAAFLRQNGFAMVKSMAGGIDAWSRQVDPSQPLY